MDIKLNESQVILQRNAREVLTNECPRSLVRAVERDDRGYSPELWQKLGDLGFLGLGIPASYGGAEGSMLDRAVLHEELGRAIAPTPHLVAALAAEVLLALGSDAQKSAILPALASGAKIITFAYLEPEASWRATGISLTARPTNAGTYVLNGTKILVPFANTADQMLVVARSGGDGKNGISVFLVDRDAAGISREKLLTISGGPDYEVVFNNVEVTPAAVVGPLGGAWAGLSAAMAKAAVLQSAELMGIGQVALDFAVEFSKTRVQFGRPIGTFQAISHKLANMSLELDSARLIVQEAAWSMDQGGDNAAMAATAKTAASNSSKIVIQGASDVMGGLGFMEVHDLGLFFRRQKAGELNLGDASVHEDTLLEALAAL